MLPFMIHRKILYGVFTCWPRHTPFLIHLPLTFPQLFRALGCPLGFWPATCLFFLCSAGLSSKTSSDFWSHTIFFLFACSLCIKQYYLTNTKLVYFNHYSWVKNLDLLLLGKWLCKTLRLPEGICWICGFVEAGGWISKSQDFHRCFCVALLALSLPLFQSIQLG